MNDVRALLSEAVPEDLRTSYPWPDAGPDLGRGRALLLTAVRGGHSTPAPTGQAGVALVAYQGSQPKGYTLRTIPQGWEVASADRIGLVLHRIGSPKGGTYEDKILIQGDLNPFPASGDRAVRVRTGTSARW